MHVEALGSQSTWHKPKVAPADHQCESVRVNLVTIVQMKSSICFEQITQCALMMMLLLTHNGLIVLSGMVFGAKRKKDKHEEPALLLLLPTLFFPLPVTLRAIS